MPRAQAWTRRQKGLIVGSVVLALASFGALIYGYERYHRGPDDSFFVGTWRGQFEKSSSGNYLPGYHFKADHSFDEISRFSDGSEISGPAGKWFAGGDFLYLRLRLDDPSGPYDKLEAWHIDTMTPTELHMQWDGTHISLKRVE
jgi:hypothetical protein